MLYLEYEAHGWYRFALRGRGEDWRLYNRSTLLLHDEQSKLSMDGTDPGGWDRIGVLNITAASSLAFDLSEEHSDAVRSERGEGFLGSLSRTLSVVRSHPDCWKLPMTGLFLGLFSNIVPVQGGLLLVPLFQRSVVQLIQSHCFITI